MSVNKVNSDGSLSRVAGGTLYADAPIGTISPFGGSVVPSGYLLCNGQAVSRTTYAELFAVISTAFGTGDGSTTFNVPDLREATTKGAGLSGKSSVHYDSDGVALGEFVPDRIKSHAHNVYVRDAGHAHGTDSGAGLPNPNNLGITKNEAGIGWSAYPSAGTASNTQSVSANIQVSSTSNFSSVDNATTANGSATNEVKAVGVNYIIKAKMVGVPADFLAKVDEAVEDVYGDIIPSDASASNKLVAHQTPYESFTLNNNSGSQKWYKLGTYMSGNNTARLDFVSARVDGQMFESSVRISGVGADANYISWIGENGSEISIFAIKVDTNRNLYAQINSYSAIEIRVYGTFTLDIAEQSSTPSGTDIPLQKLVTESDLTPVISTATPTAQLVSGDVKYIKSGNICTVCFNSLTVNTNEPNRLICTGLPLPLYPIFFGCVSNDIFYTMNVNDDGSLRDANNTTFGNKSNIYGSVTYVCR